MKLYGDQAKYFEMELKPRIKHKKVGCLSMVNNGGDMHGSQFCITLSPDIDYLDGKHTVFGEVAEGSDVLKKLNETFVDGEGRPYQDIRIFHTVVLDDPFDDPAGLGDHIPDRSPQPTKEQLDSGRLGVDEKVDDTEGMSSQQVAEMLAEKQARANAELLEMVGDLPDADVKPPDNVLFVCKLNPVTTDGDLEIIFSRFGEIKSCEVIRDKNSGESLQYAFIEFDKEEDCESAYFKMDNVLIDERRIHVDFSQSVSKIKWKGKGKGVEHFKEEEVPRYKIKDRTRKDDRYDLVFAGDDMSDTTSSSRGKKKKRRSPSPETSRQMSPRLSKSSKHKRRPRSRSPRRSRSHSPDRRYKDGGRSKDRSHNRHRESDRRRKKYDDDSYRSRHHRH